MPMKVGKTAPRGAVPESDFRRNPLQHIRWLYATFTQQLFSYAPRGAYHWDPQMENTDLIVTAESPLNADVLNDRPGITFTRAPIGFFQLGFDDMLTYDFRSGRKEKSMLVPGTMVINCCSRVDLESEHLAWVTAEHLWLLRDLMMKAGFYDVGRGLTIGAPSPAGALVTNDGADEWFVTSINSPFHFYRTSAFTPLNQNILQEIGMVLRGQPIQPIHPSAHAVPNPMAGTGAGGADPSYEQVSQVPPPSLPQQQPGQAQLPLQPHPLNPAQLVSVKVVSGAGLQQPSINGRRLPIQRVDVGDSRASSGVTINVKV